MFQHILTICTGNICRSPLAQAMLKVKLTQRKPQVEVRSAGIGALVGHAVESTTKKLNANRGLELDTHCATQITPALIRWAELILVMEQHHLDYILSLEPSARGKTFLLGHWTGTSIPDPYQRDETIHLTVHQLISDSVDTWVKNI